MTNRELNHMVQQPSPEDRNQQHQKACSGLQCFEFESRGVSVSTICTHNGLQFILIIDLVCLIMLH